MNFRLYLVSVLFILDILLLPPVLNLRQACLLVLHRPGLAGGGFAGHRRQPVLAFCRPHESDNNYDHCGIVSLVLWVLILVQTGVRAVELAVLSVTGSVMSIGLTNPDQGTFSVWWRELARESFWGGTSPAASFWWTPGKGAATGRILTG